MAMVNRESDGDGDGLIMAMATGDSEYVGIPTEKKTHTSLFLSEFYLYILQQYSCLVVMAIVMVSLVSVLVLVMAMVMVMDNLMLESMRDGAQFMQ